MFFQDLPVYTQVREFEEEEKKKKKAKKPEISKDMSIYPQ